MQKNVSSYSQVLVLTRKLNESIVLTLPDGEEIKILIADIVGGKVSVGISAPENVKILREELI